MSTENLRKWRDKHLNSVSPSFCAAKWYNVSLHLGHGYTNSCHLPLPHPIDLEKVKANPSELHNTDFKKRQRKMMLEGKRPAECSYCWRVEDIGRDNIGDRVYKSRIYKEKDIAELKYLPWDAAVIPKTIEASFDRTCNFGCSYCNAGYSTTWGKDINKFGPYQKFKSVSAGAYQNNGEWADTYGKYMEKNPYVQAFLKWWPDLIEGGLEEIRITGGEPCASPNFWNFLDVMKKHPSEHLRLAVNSNLGGNFKRIQKKPKLVIMVDCGSTSFEAVKKDRFTGLTGTGVTLSHSVNSVQDIVCWVNNVKQDYNNYTVSNTALTLGGSLVSADVVQILYKSPLGFLCPFYKLIKG